MSVFVQPPPWNVVLEVLKLLSLPTDFPINFRRSELKLSDETLEQVCILLWGYYKPYYAKSYLSNISEKMTMLILRQILLPHNYILSARDTTRAGRHVRIYNISSLADSSTLPTAITISFD